MRRAAAASYAWRNVVGCGPSAMELIQLLSRCYLKYHGLGIDRSEFNKLLYGNEELKKRIKAFYNITRRIQRHTVEVVQWNRSTYVQPLPLP